MPEDLVVYMLFSKYAQMYICVSAKQTKRECLEKYTKHYIIILILLKN